MTTNKLIGGILLIASAAIGAGMLALPLITGNSGFLVSVVGLGLGFAYMLLCLFLFLEANLDMPDPTANIISMANRHFGKIGKSLAWGFFLLLMYAICAAYLSGIAGLMAKVSEEVFSFHHPDSVWMVELTLMLGVIIFLGTRWVDYLNQFFMVFLFLAYFAMVIFLIPQVKPSRLLAFQSDFLTFLPGAMPVIVLSFTSHIILPTLRSYLGEDLAQIKKVLYWGSLIPLVFYLVWELIILGLLPMTGPWGLDRLAVSSQPVGDLTQALKESTGLTSAALYVGVFSFSALLTSFLLVGLTIVDFLADGLSLPKTFRGRLLALVLALTPPLVVALYFPSAFMMALGYGGVCIVMLYCIFPALMIWKVRYSGNKLPLKRYQVMGGKPILMIALLGGIIVIGLQIALTAGWIV